MSSDHDKTPAEQAVEQALDLFVYAPIGLLFEGASLLPELVTKGRNQVAVAKMFGRMAVQQASAEATKAVDKLQDQAAGVLDFLSDGILPQGEDQPTPPPAPRPRAAREVRPERKPPAGAKKAAGVDAASLSIPDYDSLSASHVVNRLGGLTPDELEQVRRYEAAHRGRKTILSKISQLEG